MKTRDKWIDETMESLDGISGAKADPHLFEKIQPLNGKNVPTNVLFPTRILWQVAAGLAFLITMNILSYVQYNRMEEGVSTSNPIVNEYFTYIETVKF